MRKLLLVLILAALPAFAINTAVGYFVQGQASITLTFTPKALLVWTAGTGAHPITADGSARDAGFAVGFCGGSTAQSTLVGMGFLDIAGSTTAFKYGASARCIGLYDKTTKYALASVTFSSNTATFDWTTSPNTNAAGSTGALWGYLAIGGSDATVQVGSMASFTTGYDTTHGVVSTMTCKPSVVFTSTFGSSTATPTTGTATAQGAFGVSTFPTSTATGANQGTLLLPGVGGLGWDAADAVATSTTRLIHSAQYATNIYSSTSSLNLWARHRLTALASNGFSFESFATNAATPVFYMAICGGVWQVNHATQPVAGGAQSQVLVTPGMTPSALLAFTGNRTAVDWTDKDTNIRMGMGASDGTNYYAAAAGALGDKTNPQISTSNVSRSFLLRFMTEGTSGGVAAPTFQAAIDTVSFADGKATIHWSTIDTTPRIFTYLTVGNAPATPSTGDRRVF